MRVAFRSVVSISFLCLALSAFSFEVRADGTDPTVYPSACGPQGHRVCGNKCCGTAYGGGQPPLYCCGLGMSMMIYCDEQKVNEGTEYEASLLDECPSGHDCLTVMVGSQRCYYDAPTCEEKGYSSECEKIDEYGVTLCTEDDKVQTPEGRTCYINDEEEAELGQVCEILPEETPTGTGYIKCCNTVNTCGDYGLLTEEEKNIKAAMYEERDNPCPASVCPDNRTIIYHRWYDCSESTEHAGCYECKLNNCREYLTGAPTSLCGIGGNIYPGDYNKSSSSSSSCRSAINEEDAVAHNYSGLMDHAKYFQVYTNEDTGDEIKCYYTCKRGDHIDSNNECDITKQGKSQGRIYKITDSKYYALKYNDVSGAIGRLASGTCGGSALSYFGGDEEAGKWKIPTPGQFIDMANWLQGSSSTETANVNEMSYNILTYNTYGSSATGSGSSWNECYLVGIPSYTENESLRCTDAHGPYISANCNTSTSSTREVKIINKWF